MVPRENDIDYCLASRADTKENDTTGIDGLRFFLDNVVDVCDAVSQRFDSGVSLPESDIDP